MLLLYSLTELCIIHDILLISYAMPSSVLGSDNIELNDTEEKVIDLPVYTILQGKQKSGKKW